MSESSVFFSSPYTLSLVLNGLLLVGLLVLIWHVLQQNRRLDKSSFELQQASDLREHLLVEKQDAIAQLQERLAQVEHKWEQSQQRIADLQRDLATKETQLTEREQYFKRQLEQFIEQKNIMKVEFEQLSQHILKQREQEFSANNQQRLASILDPLKQDLQGFRTRVDQIHQAEVEQRSALKQELINLQTLNKSITENAEKLTNALKGDKKLQGNWGELMLENVLDAAGLRKDIDYVREYSQTTVEGRKRPDAVVRLPQNRHLIIDAKTSLNAYTDYVNSDNELDRQAALKSHVGAIAARIKELSDKDYQQLSSLNSPDVVIMFIPIESAYVDALKYDPRLIEQALAANILVTTPTTLLTSLKIVAQLWRFEQQSKHSAELASRAEKFYNKLRSFLDSMLDVGKRLDSARVSYDKAMGQFERGQNNLIKQAAEFKDLGVAVKQELPQELLERARLELPPESPASDH